MEDLRIHTRDLQNKKGGRINLLNRTQPFQVLAFFLSSFFLYIYILHIYIYIFSASLWFKYRF